MIKEAVRMELKEYARIRAALDGIEKEAGNLCREDAERILACTGDLREKYNPGRVIAWYDRIYDEYWTLDGTRRDKFGRPIKEPEDKE